MLLLEKNMNGFTTYVTKPKCTCSLLIRIEWGLESLYQKSINLKFFFISCLKILKTVKMSTWLYFSLLLFAFLKLLFYSLLSCFIEQMWLLSEKELPSMFMDMPQNACLLLCGYEYKDKNTLRSVYSLRQQESEAFD